MKWTLSDYISITIHQTDLALTGYIKEKLSDYNLAPEQNLIMMLLWEQNGLTQNEISQKLNKDKTNVARMAYNLEKKGFIQRVHTAGDKRSLKLSLTEKGHNLGELVIPIAEEFHKMVTSGLTDKEITELRRLLSIIHRNVE
ncbi:MarR family winged helix-turn-helix transcriptional regulator [Alteribacillus sp. HJP-4]|uniref:MarR family winged helix-turn-helix transcriptional regulator n=1 Tax=Alteribacillus sp. HJP-4 TaxID=2775394 RepID=UPI0035CCEFFA